MTTDVMAVLRRTSLLGAAPEQDLERAVAVSRVRAYPRGQIVFTRGDPADTLIVVISGRPLVPDAAGEPDFLAMAGKLGAVSSLPKPFRPAELLAKVESCLKARDHNAASGC